MAKNRFKILIVEDDANIRTFVRTMLEAEDYQVLCAADCSGVAFSCRILYNNANTIPFPNKVKIAQTPFGSV